MKTESTKVADAWITYDAKWRLVQAGKAYRETALIHARHSQVARHAVIFDDNPALKSLVDALQELVKAVESPDEDSLFELRAAHKALTLWIGKEGE